MNRLERTVMSYCAAIDTKIAAQLNRLIVSGREHTGVGSYTRFASIVLPANERIEREGPYLQLRLSSPRMPSGGGAILWVGSDGAVQQLEFYCHDGGFPADDFEPIINEEGA